MKILKIKYLLLMVISTIVVSFFAEAARAERKIGFLAFSEETRYSDARRGIMDELKELGVGEPATVFIVENAGGNKAKAAELVNKFTVEKIDLIFTMGTSATIPIARAIKDVPIVFSNVYDPVAAKIAEDWQSSGNNTTGVSSAVPMVKVVDALIAFVPVRRLAVLYTPGEKNSEAQLKDLLAIQDAYQFKVIPVPLTRKEEIVQTVPEVARTADALYITGSNLVGVEISTIVDIATKAKVVTITHLDDLVDMGVLLGVAADPYQQGRLAAKKAMKILQGAKPSSLPIETMKEFNLMLNMKTARAGQFQIPPPFLRMVNKKIE